MSKIFPIKVERAEPQEYRIVEWMLHNVCNYNCSFCSPKCKDGSQRWLDIEVYKATCKKIIDEAKEPVWFKITGGEPTLFPQLIELLTFIKNNGGFTYIISNGSRTLRYWEELRDLNIADFIAFTYHPEQTSEIDHLVNVVNLFHDTPTIIINHVTCIPDYFDKAVEAHNLLLSKCSTISTLQHINDHEYMDKYTDEQKQILFDSNFVYSPSIKDKTFPTYHQKYWFTNGKLKYTFNDGSTEIDDGLNFIKREMADFRGWECEIGIKLIRIEHETIYRAVCERGGKWSIYDDNMFATESIICDNNGPCTCSLDIIETKRR